MRGCLSATFVIAWGLAGQITGRTRVSSVAYVGQSPRSIGSDTGAMT
jgi:hypothetical protein